MGDFFKIVLFLAHFAVSVTLIILVMSQTSRHEGLGAVGGSSTPPSRGRAGVDEQLQVYTKYAAIAFMILSAVLYVCSLKYRWV